ncbi:ABC transporter substrate-binding protein [Anopheles sinensis]|uniref:ABC transporter substrate-binding protein n=1 Tax=Anopheles sinensis TaxID=74873 RepID=A0A084W0U8_ANOSI|nr:ABC transporter substrate-binding protein [Anopheles sinensis]
MIEIKSLASSTLNTSVISNRHEADPEPRLARPVRKPINHFGKPFLPNKSAWAKLYAEPYTKVREFPPALGFVREKNNPLLKSAKSPSPATSRMCSLSHLLSPSVRLPIHCTTKAQPLKATSTQLLWAPSPRKGRTRRRQWRRRRTSLGSSGPSLSCLSASTSSRHGTNQTEKLQPPFGSVVLWPALGTVHDFHERAGALRRWRLRGFARSTLSSDTGTIKEA